MPSRPPHPCSTPGCPVLVTRGSHCEKHRQEKFVRRSNRKDPRQVAFYGSQQWKAIRGSIRQRDPICRACNRVPSQCVDHIDGNFRNNDPENLQGLCFPCHAEKSGHQHGQKQKAGRFIILVGPAGVGKTAIRAHLAPLLKVVSLGPDDFGGDWHALYQILDNVPSAVVECCIASGTLLRRGDDRGMFIVEVSLDEETRRRRLSSRGESEMRIEHFMAEPKRLGYERHVVPHLTVDASCDPGDNAVCIAEAYLSG